eukprot:gnl/MRDRNA2_/MRDRNA2_57489_c0_seq1.p1 gnl/MRDRNA2_/MRDRNA2_57489_c0~~gnl/MRDRNA2_/MRDRNA2_57489_c0_seq1.p1  ORF type:complete len:437 (+),score=28.82 gnl/MRDRNA2_/MRDRNA2_57489_c0_seq1:92-1402(+)
MREGEVEGRDFSSAELRYLGQDPERVQEQLELEERHREEWRNYDPEAEASKYDKETMRTLYRRILCLGGASFFCLPITYCMARLGWNGPMYVFLGFYFVGGTLAQLYFLREVEAYFLKDTRAHMQGYHSVCKKFRSTTCCIPQWFFVMLSGSVEYVDPGLDAGNAGQSYATWSDEKAAIFQASWEHLPLIGKVIGSMGLPGALTCVLLFFTCFQLYYFRNILSMDETDFLILGDFTEPDPLHWIPGYTTEDNKKALRSRQQVWIELQDGANVGGCMLLADALWSLVKHDEEQLGLVDLAVSERTKSFLTKVAAENCPMLWLQVSLLAIVYDDLSGPQLGLMLFSICTSLMTIIKALPAQYHRGQLELPNLDERQRKEGRQREGLGFKMRIVNRYFVPPFIATVILLLSMVRFVGIWVCPSHILNVTSGCLAAHSVK